MYSHIEGNTTRRMIALVAVMALLFVGLFAAPALAGKPDSFTVPTTFGGIDNPCTGLPFEATGELEIRANELPNGNFVGHWKATGTSTDGYVLTHGVDNFQANGNVVREALTDIWRHPDGSAFRVQLRFVYDISADEYKVDTFSASCLGS